MVEEENNRQADKTTKQQFRHIRRGPLDAYIYKQGSDHDKVEETQENMFVSIPTTVIPSSHLPSSRKIHIFTDGACTNNGKRNANAAWGLLVVDEFDTILYKDSGAIPKSQVQTNQRAELQGLLNGLRQANLYPGLITIWSDSQYSINCASVWGPKWRVNGWKKQGGPIQHLDLIRSLVCETVELGHRVSYRWLKAHTSGYEQNQFPWKFNHQVDALATSALA